MTSGPALFPYAPAEDGSPRLSQSVVGACLRSAFIEALYDDCTDMLPAEAPVSQPLTMTLAAE